MDHSAWGAGGVSAEYGHASGGVFNFITKSGGNAFRGGARCYLNDKSLVGDNITVELTSQGITTGNKILKQHNLGLDLGGPIRKNRVWFNSDWSQTSKTESSPALAGVVDPT